MKRSDEIKKRPASKEWTRYERARGSVEKLTRSFEKAKLDKAQSLANLSAFEDNDDNFSAEFVDDEAHKRLSDSVDSLRQKIHCIESSLAVEKRVINTYERSHAHDFFFGYYTVLLNRELKRLKAAEAKIATDESGKTELEDSALIEPKIDEHECLLLKLPVEIIVDIVEKASPKDTTHRR